MLKQKNHLLCSIIGMDISASYIKVVQISRDAEHIYLENAALFPLTNYITINNHIENKQVITSAIQKLLLPKATWGKNVVIAISDCAVIKKMIQVTSTIARQNIEEYILLEVSKYFSCPIHEISLDFSLQEAMSNGTLKFLTVACKTTIIEKMVTAITAADLLVRIVEIESFALKRLVLFFAESISLFEQKKILQLFIIICLLLFYL